MLSDKCSAIIDAIVEIRKSKGWTQKKLADECGYTQSVIARLESKKAEPQISTLIQIAAALGYTLEIVPQK